MTIRSLAAMLVVLLGPGPARSDEALIRAARARFNEAIRTHDSTTIDAVWADDIVTISSRGNVSSGRAANRATFAAIFAERPDVIYVRSPETVRVLEPWTTASEAGTWRGRWTAAGSTIEVSGQYLAQWKRIGTEWRLTSEYFVPLECRGAGYCGR